ncbi:MAG: leucyl aminopeptidase [Chloroflexi bacterium]|nr:leucyl aminopeptidase [Chloroflexota bacterium]
MEIRAVKGAIQDAQIDTLILGVTQGDSLDEVTELVDAALSGAIKDLMSGGDFSGKSGEEAILYPRGAIPARRVLLLGLGERDDLSLEVIRRAAANGLRKANAVKAAQVMTLFLYLANIATLSVEATARVIAEGARLALYQYHGQKSDDAPEMTIQTVDLLVFSESDLDAAQAGIDTGLAMAEGVTVTRDLVNLPPNVCTPIHMATIAEQIAKDAGLKVEILDEAKMRELKMGALLAVAQGSDTPPRFIILEHNADKASELDTVVLVGKGVTFDTGGYSLKTRDGMIGMKADMAGGAAVIGAMRAIAALEVPLHVVGLVPAADNMVSGNAYRPQEVVVASNGTSIEVISTDAEGRMLLADALVYAKRYEPSAVIDIATLTGSCMIALGAQAAGLFSDNDALRDVLTKAAEITHERVWPLPVYKEYAKSLESETADTKNSGDRWGGASVAALFLSNFVDYPAWAHLDIAGMAANAKDIPYAPKGATGYGVRLLAEFTRQWSQRSN